MQILKIEKNYNGSHDDQTLHGTLPDGWAVIPDDMDMPNFPFGDVEAEEIDGVMTVTKWTAGEMPEPQPMPEPEPTADELMDILLGVEA